MQTLWQTVLNDLELQVSKAVFQTFISQMSLLSINDSIATIGCNQPMLINFVEKRYYQMIKKTLDSYTQSDLKLVFNAKKTDGKKQIDGPLFTLKIDSHTGTPVIDVKLNPNYTFENFAVSTSNHMAYAAATAVASAPGTSYNPLFLYGGVGVGKTHLMQAIGHFSFQKKSKLKLIYCTGEEFTNEIIEAIGNKTTSLFKKKYRQLDLLLIDDVQFIAGKYFIQEEFFHTFNAIQQVKGQIVMTSDRPPEEINKLELRLKSRFEGGLTIDIGQPDFELRTAILLIKAKQRKIDLPIELAKLLASNVENIRKLEGVFIRVLTEAQIRNVAIDNELIKSVLGKTVKESPAKNNINPAKVIDIVASYFNLKLSQLKSNKRDRIFALPRQILYYLLRVEVGVPLMDIGELLGGRDHTTILYGVRKISNLLSTDEKIQEDIMGIKNKLY